MPRRSTALARATAFTGSTSTGSTNDGSAAWPREPSEIAPSQELGQAVLAVAQRPVRPAATDAEGVTKRVAVTGAATARWWAQVIARDSLVKTALFGSDPNWGRVLAAVGMAPVELNPDRINVLFNGSPVCVNGTGAPGARDVDLSGPDVTVVVELGVGTGDATIRTTDLSHAYVEENSAYSS
jgi:glutamate N-acetyltransferase/amino-acid N-acetyltransferase